MNDESQDDSSQTDGNRHRADRGDPEPSSETQRKSLSVEFLEFLLKNKKWWLAPVLIVGLLMSVLVIATNSHVAPFIYTLF